MTRPGKEKPFPRKETVLNMLKHVLPRNYIFLVVSAAGAAAELSVAAGAAAAVLSAAAGAALMVAVESELLEF